MSLRPLLSRLALVLAAHGMEAVPEDADRFLETDGNFGSANPVQVVADRTIRAALLPHRRGAAVTAHGGQHEGLATALADAVDDGAGYEGDLVNAPTATGYRYAGSGRYRLLQIGRCQLLSDSNRHISD